MASYLSYLYTPKKPVETGDVTVAVAESVTAGALSTSLCSEPGASDYFKGGIIAYSKNSKKDILSVDTDFAEMNNFGNPFTTAEMARAVVKQLKSRIGIATTGYSLPVKREESLDKKECALDIKIPYAYICIYDSLMDTITITHVEYTKYDSTSNKSIQKASAQALFALEAHRMYDKLVMKIKENEKKEKENILRE
jgi:PncC family amidohydrolase